MLKIKKYNFNNFYIKSWLETIVINPHVDYNSYSLDFKKEFIKYLEEKYPNQIIVNIEMLY